MKTKLLENFLLRKKTVFSSEWRFFSGKRYQTNQYHSWLGHEDKGQKGKSDPEENINLSSLMAEIKIVAKGFQPILFP